MAKENYNRLLNKLLNICASKALIEEAFDTRESLLCLSDIFRYIYDEKKIEVTLSSEIELLCMYLELLGQGSGLDVGIKTEFDIKSNEVYIKHLDLFSKLVADIEHSSIKSDRTVYFIENNEKLDVAKNINGESKLIVQIEKL